MQSYSCGLSRKIKNWNLYLRSSFSQLSKLPRGLSIKINKRLPFSTLIQSNLGFRASPSLRGSVKKKPQGFKIDSEMRTDSFFNFTL